MVFSQAATTISFGGNTLQERPFCTGKLCAWPFSNSQNKDRPNWAVLKMCLLIKNATVKLRESKLRHRSWAKSHSRDFISWSARRKNADELNKDALEKKNKQTRKQVITCKWKSVIVGKPLEDKTEMSFKKGNKTNQSEASNFETASSSSHSPWLMKYLMHLVSFG